MNLRLKPIRFHYGYCVYIGQAGYRLKDPTYRVRDLRRGYAEILGHKKQEERLGPLVSGFPFGFEITS